MVGSGKEMERIASRLWVSKRRSSVAYADKEDAIKHQPIDRPELLSLYASIALQHHMHRGCCSFAHLQCAYFQSNHQVLRLQFFALLGSALLSSSSSGGRPHHSLWNFSCSFFLFSFSSLCCLRSSLVANHSSLAASCSSCPAWDIIHVFIARRCERHFQVAEKVRLCAQDAKSGISSA